MNKHGLSNANDLELPEYLKREFSVDEIDQLHEQFSFVDESGDGSLDVDELQTIMTSLGIHITTDRLSKLINEVDDNNSGALEFPEFVKLISNLRKGKGGLLARFIQNSKQASIIRKEFDDIQQNPPMAGCTIEYDGLIRRWNIHLPGPNDTPYENGTFILSVSFGKEYPYEAPVMRFVTRIYHLNFPTIWNGSATMNCILKEWTPAWNIRRVLLNIMELMKEPNLELMDQVYGYPPVELTHSRTCRVAGEESIFFYLTDRAQYDTLARQFTVDYAHFKQISETHLYSK